MEQKIETSTFKVSLDGIAEIQFDRFEKQEADTRPPDQKLYLAEGDVIVLPSENIWAFLFGEGKPAGCAKSFEGKGSVQYLRMGQSHLILSPPLIPFTRNGKPIVFKEFDRKSLYVSQFAPRTKSGSLSIKNNVRLRPVLMLPWALSFDITIIKNELITDTKLLNWFKRGGIEIGLGNYRPRFGRFLVNVESAA